MAKKLDRYDQKILYHLDIDARASASSIAKKIRLPKETVHYRIKRLIKKGYITSFYTITNASKLGFTKYFIFLKFYKLTPAKEKQMIAYLMNEKSCSHVNVIDGYYDLSVGVLHRTLLDLKAFLQKFANLFGTYLLEKNIHTVITSHKLNQKMLYKDRTVRKSFYHGEPSSYNVDAIDVGIIKNIATEARIRLVDLARRLKEDPRVVRYHLKKLEKEGIIVNYSVSLNREKFFYESVQVDIKLKDPKKVNSIIEYFDATNTCVFAYELLGSFDLSVDLNVESDEQLRSIMATFKELFVENYIDYEISSIYRSYIVNLTPFLSAQQEEAIKKKGIKPYAPHQKVKKKVRIKK